MANLFKKLFELVAVAIEKKELDLARLLLNYYYNDVTEGRQDPVCRRLPLAEAYFAKGDLKEAAIQFFLSAKKMSRHDQAESAIEICEKLLGFDPKNEFACQLLANIYQVKGQPDKQAVYLQKAREILAEQQKESEARFQEVAPIFEKLIDNVTLGTIDDLIKVANEGDSKAMNKLIDLQRKIMKALVPKAVN
ncbi:MAG: hypothetical protein NTX82_06490 [Candidatus Parcubacteria bacterium]|nr:hypothetical protein [Candidatus Parcubacteria bacterium]